MRGDGPGGDHMAKRILLIEDNEDIALVVKTTLQLRKHEVLTAGDGLQGLEMAQSGPFDLVILDVLLPEIDGLEVLRSLKADPATADVPVALFSANVDEQEARDALRAGAAAVLRKPFDPRQFVREVEALLGGDR